MEPARNSGKFYSPDNLVYETITTIFNERKVCNAGIPILYMYDALYASHTF
jgi:hypothetical protein